MIIGFSTVFPKGKGKLSGRLTRFPERIIKSFGLIDDKRTAFLNSLSETIKDLGIESIRKD